MKLIKRIGALLVTLAMLCSLLVIVPNNVVSNVKALDGSGPQGYVSSHIYEGCDLSFWNVNDNDYAYNGALDDSGADYSLLDFDKMKAAGCDFVILRCGSEDSSGKYIDPHFYTLYDMAREADLDIGLYYYSYATTYAGAVEEAEFVINAIEEAGMYFEYPIYYDVEESDQLTSSVAPNICKGWCETMVEHGYFPGIYGNYSLHDVLTTEVLNTYDFWLAYVSTQEGVSSYNPSNMNVSSDCAVWQYSFYGYGWDGIYYYSSSVGALLLDSNVSYKDYPAIMAQYGYNNIAGGVSTPSKGATYTHTNTRDDIYADDFAKMTDGKKGSTLGGDSTLYSGWFTPELEIIIDLGDAVETDTYNVYGALNSSWGITDPPTELVVSISDSQSGPFTEIASTTTVNTVDTSSEWTTYQLNATTDTAQTARYIKFSIAAPDAGDSTQPGSGHIWLDEIEAKSTLSEDSGNQGGTTTTVINSIELTTTSAFVAGNTIFTPTVKSVNGDTSLVSAAQSATLTQWWDEAGTSQYASGTVFEEGTVYDLYFKFTCNSGYEIADDCTMTLQTANGTITGEMYTTYTDDTNAAFDFIVAAAAAGSSTPDPEPTDVVISSIELNSTGSAAAGNSLFTATLVSINGDVELASAATSLFETQWYDETGTTALGSSTVFEEGVVYDLYVKVTRSTGYTFAENITYTLTTADGTYTGTIYASESTEDVNAFDFYVTGLASSGEGGEDPVEKLVIESLEFEVLAPDPAVGNDVFYPTLVSVNGDASLLSYISESHTSWWTITGSTVTEYSNTTFEALNVGFQYDLYFSITATDDAEISAVCTLKLTTSSRTHNGTLYTYTPDSNNVAFDIYFQTETVKVPDQSIFITGFNTSIVAGAAQIFTPDFGTVSNDTANVIWTANAIAKYDEELDQYIVTELIFPTETGCTVDRTLDDDEIFIAVHWDDSETDGVTEANRTALMSVQVGMALEFNNIDLENKTIGSNPTITFSTINPPVVSLGAQVNSTLYGIRFGATYNKVFGYGEVTGLGFLLISEYRLGDNALDLNYESNSAIADYVVKVEARTIVEYVEGKDFSDYETFTFYASVVRLDRKDNLDDNIVAVPYITYATGKSFVGEQLKNSYNGVLAGNSSL